MSCSTLDLFCWMDVLGVLVLGAFDVLVSGVPVMFSDEVSRLLVSVM